MVGGREKVRYCEGLKRDQIVKIARLSGCKKYVSKLYIITNAFIDLKPVEKFEDGSDMCGFRSLNNSTSKRVLNLLEPVKLTVWKICDRQNRSSQF